MKKITRVLAGLLIFGMFFSCANDNTVDTPDDQNDIEQPGTSDPGSQTPVNPNPEQPKKIEAVTFNPAAGEVEAGTKVTLSTTTENAVIYYEFIKADGAATITKENFKINKYSEPVEIKEAGTLYAIAVESESSTNVSEISKAAYTIKATGPVIVAPETVTFSLEAGEVEAGTTVTLSTTTENAVIYYEFVKEGETATLTKENFKINKYSEPVEIKEAGTLYAIAAESEESTNVSEISSVAYTIKATSPVIVGPEDAIRNWTAESTVTAWSVYNFADLEKLAEIVNDGNDLAGVTITQKEDIAINESVLGDKFEEPVEAEAGVANAELKNFAGIGSASKPFAGTYDGNGKQITGLYIYGAQQGLGFFGGLKAATIKNVVIIDGCVVNKNVQVKESGSHDGSDDDRFGGLIGVTSEGENSIENCIYVGTVGSKAAYDRDHSYEYIGGIIGRVESSTTANLKNCYSLVKLYGTAAGLVEKVKGTVNFDNCYGVTLDKKLYTKADNKVAFEAEDKDEIIAAVKDAFGIDLSSYFTKAELDIAPVPVEPAEFSVQAGEIEVGSTIKLSAAENTKIYYEIVKDGDETTLTAENYESATKYSEPITINETVTIYAIVVGRHKVSEITSAKYTAVQPTEPIPEDSIRNWTAESTATAWSVYNFSDLKKLAEIVNGGKNLAGVTITQKEDITINESVLGEKFAEPAEAAAGEPNADLKNFAGIGSKSNPFAGTYDGNGKKISGLYIYGGQQGLGFIGAVNGATVKNVIILDACVVNKNETSSDGSDDDRFGGLIGLVIKNASEITIENCIYVGTVGSQAAKDRGGAYEYVGGIIGRVESGSTVNLSKCVSLVKLYGDSAALIKRVDGTANCTDCIGVDLKKNVYSDAATTVTLDAEGGISKSEIIETVKTACGLDLTDYFTKAGL